MSGWRARGAGIAAIATATVSLAACGSGARQDASEPSGNFSVEVQKATFPLSQRLAEHSHLVISIRNADQRTIPDVAVTISDPALGTTAQAFGYRISSRSLPELASASRALWIVDKGPDPTGCGYSCQQGGPGGGTTAYANTWALGALAPGRTVTFDWALTAVHTGTHMVQYTVAAGLNGKAKAVASGGGQPQGTFKVTVASRPRTSFVNDAGQVVNQ